MHSVSPQRSLPLSSRVDPAVVQVLRVLDPIARTADCEYFLGGATARDIVLVNVHGLRPGRATRDIDFGVAVESWSHFERLKLSLAEISDFVADRHARHRLIYTDQRTGASIPVDLIPFRGVAANDSTIAWPPGRHIVMNVAGFEEAFRSAVLIQIESGLAVRVVSTPGLTLLKLTAWADRGTTTNKDATDLYRLLTAYADAGNIDRLYDSELDLLESVAFDLELAGAELLGRDVAALCSPRLLSEIRSLLAPESCRERLILQMMRTSAYEEAEPAIERMTNGFLKGLMTPN